MSDCAPRSRDVVVSAQSLSKKYRLFQDKRDRIKEVFDPRGNLYHKEHWALRDLSFEVKRGEVLGIVGTNGSGKSTLLQLISGAVEPTSGSLKINGSIAAMLELGAGFNPEFSGYENSLLTGEIMGYSAKQMRTLIPEIKDFAGISDFFDHPVKTYSTGMFVRVAFAALTCIRPDVLIVDEALSVGDARFQHKCFQRIERFRDQGTTILLVSHDITQITTMCDTAIMLEAGKVVAEGAPRDVADVYIKTLMSSDLPSDANRADSAPTPPTLPLLSGMCERKERIENSPNYCADENRYGDGTAEILDAVIEADQVFEPGEISTGALVTLHIQIKIHRDMLPSYGFGLKTVAGVDIYGSNTFMLGKVFPMASAGTVQTVRLRFHAPLQAGDYFLDLGITAIDGTDGGSPADVRRSVLTFAVRSSKKRQFDGLINLNPTVTVS